MSFIATIIGTAERVPVARRRHPRRDLRAVRTHRDAARPGPTSWAMRSLPGCSPRGRSRSIPTLPTSQPLRGAGRVLCPGARAEPQILLLLLQGTRHRRCRRPRRRRCGQTVANADLQDGQDHSRARLRLGLAVAVHGPAIPARKDHGGLELALPAPGDRGDGSRARPAQPARHHRRHERIRPRRGASTAWSRSRCSST